MDYEKICDQLKSQWHRSCTCFILASTGLIASLITGNEECVSTKGAVSINLDTAVNICLNMAQKPFPMDIF